MLKPLVLLVPLGLAACKDPPPTGTPPTTTDTDTGEPHILPNDSYPLPEDTAPETIPDLEPSHWVYLEQDGAWVLGAASPPFGSMSGDLHIREFVDELDTAAPAYECDVRYALTGTEQTTHSCDACDFVFAVEHYVSEGDPVACHDPDVPSDGAIWNMGFDSQTRTIYRNYYGTGLWMPWYAATRSGTTIDFQWSGRLAIEVLDTGDM